MLDGVEPPEDELILASIVADWLASMNPSQPFVCMPLSGTPSKLTEPFASAFATEFPLKKSSCFAVVDLPPGAKASSNGTIILRR
nr:MAG TPA_asm: hypothetical protein [Caudoviricetes sp.]